MTRRLLALALVVFASGAAFGETSRYTVVMKRALRSAKLHVVTNAADRAERNVRELATLDAFAADLTDAEALELRRADGVESVERVVPRSVLSDAKPASGIAGVAPLASTQSRPWGIDASNVVPLWAHTRGKGVNVAIVDTGISATHPDLAVAGGFNAFNATAAPDDEHGHGTHVAGTVAALDNEIGVVGMAPEATLWAVKVLNATGNGTDETIAAGIDWVVAKKRALGGAWVVNMSLGADLPSLVEERAFNRAVEEGVILIAAAGNYGWEFATYPARYPTVMAIGAVDKTYARAWFSNFGNAIDIVGPGVDVASSYPRGLLRFTETHIGADKVTSSGLKGSGLGSVRGKFVDCGFGRPEDFPATGLAGRIAVVQRGPFGSGMYFREKARNAKNAGAAAVVIYNNEEYRDPSYNDWTLTTDDPAWENYQFPVTVAVSTTNGQKILANPGSDLTVTVGSHEYVNLSGTSMASPHVAGAAALLLALDPTARRTEIEHALERSARDLGAPGWDYFTGWGTLDAFEAAKELVPELFGATPSPVRRRAVRP
jgi:subtilisin family serine protease